MSTRIHEKDTGGFRHLSVKPAKIAQMEQKDLLFAQRPSEQTVSLRREFERRGNYAERIHLIRYNKLRKLKKDKNRHGLQTSGRMKLPHTILRGVCKPCPRKLYS